MVCSKLFWAYFFNLSDYIFSIHYIIVIILKIEYI